MRKLTPEERIIKKAQKKIKDAEYYAIHRVKILANVTEYRNENSDKISEQRKFHYILNQDRLIAKSREYAELNPEKISIRKKEYRDSHKDDAKEYAKGYAIANKEKLSEYIKEYTIKNQDIIKEYHKEYRGNNLQNRNKYEKNRLSSDPLYKISKSIGTLIRQSITGHGYSKTSNTAKILGCTFEFFKSYIESKFEPWMDWSCHGRCNGELNYGFDLDHIIPTSSAITEAEVIKLNHYTNFQPLCSYTNRYIKRDRLDWV